MILLDFITILQYKLVVKVVFCGLCQCSKQHVFVTEGSITTSTDPTTPRENISRIYSHRHFLSSGHLTLATFP